VVGSEDEQNGDDAPLKLLARQENIMNSAEKRPEKLFRRKGAFSGCFTNQPPRFIDS
jgi:hypothetical protein